MMQSLADTYDRIAQSWHADHQDDTWWKEGTDAFLVNLDRTNIVLDAGCGTGVKSRYMTDKGFEVVGIDISEGMLAIARETAPAAEFYQLDLAQCATLDQKFDGVLCQAALLHIPRAEAPAAVKALASVLYDGGFLYLAVKGPRPERPLEGMVTEDDYGFVYKRFFSYHSPEDLEDYCRAASLRTFYRKTVRSGSTDWVQVIARKS